MKDCPEAPEPQSHTPRDPETAREPSAIGAVRGDRPVHTPVRPLHHDRCHHHDCLSSDSPHRFLVGHHPVHHIERGGHSRDGHHIHHSRGPCIEDRQVRLPPPAATAIQVQGTTTSKVTLRRGKGDGAAPWPVRAKGPAPLPETQWGDSPAEPPFFPSVSPRAGNPGHAGAAVPRLILTGPTPAPISPHQLPQAVHSSNPMA